MFVSCAKVVVGTWWLIRGGSLGFELSIEVTLLSEDVALLNMVLLLTEVCGVTSELVTDVSELERCSNELTRPL